MPDDGIDALARIDKHEAVCTERWEASRQATREVVERLAAIERQLSRLPWWLLGSVITAALFYLANLALGAHHP